MIQHIVIKNSRRLFAAILSFGENLKKWLCHFNAILPFGQNLKIVAKRQSRRRATALLDTRLDGWWSHTETASVCAEPRPFRQQPSHIAQHWIGFHVTVLHHGVIRLLAMGGRSKKTDNDTNQQGLFSWIKIQDLYLFTGLFLQLEKGNQRVRVHATYKPNTFLAREMTETVQDYAGLFRPLRARRILVFTAGIVLLALCAVVVVSSVSEQHPVPDRVLFFTMAPYPAASQVLSVRLPPPLPKAGKQAPTLQPTRPKSPTPGPSSLRPTASPINVNRIQYRGGAVLTHPVVYVIWYGSWSAASGQATVAATERFLSSLNATRYNSILSSYYSLNQTTGVRTYISDTVVFGGSIYASPPPLAENNSLSKADIHQIATDAVVSGQFPYDPQAIYFVVTGPDVSVVGMCTSFCGWHSVLTVPGLETAAVAFAALASACPVGCAPPQYFAYSVNGQLTDGLINVISHEMCESASDPFGDGWKSNTSKAEMADLCEWTYMYNLLTDTAIGTTYNLDLSGHKFTVQGEWLNVDGNGGGYCALS